jgi:hypothetical protein
MRLHTGYFCLFLLMPVKNAWPESLPTHFQSLFQQRFFSLSTDASLLCPTDGSGFLPIEQVKQVIDDYERNNPSDLRHRSVEVLTDHTHPDHQEDLADYREDCQKNVPSDDLDLCVLTHYWDNDTEAALRVLALFYDTRTIIKHGEDYRARRFNRDHLYAFEKAIRKIPPFMRQNISKAKPLDHLDDVIKDMDADTQTLIQDAFPEDFATSIWADHTHPLTFVPGIGFKSQVVAQVYNGQNLIIFTVKGFDKARYGRLYRDINLRYLADFRMQIVVHEIAHTIDNFHFWNGDETLYYFFRYRKMSNDNATLKIINQARLALWPSKWFEAFEYLWEVNDGRYDGQTQEKLAELVAQYILIPERLQKESPEAYHWLRDDVFRGIEYQGYDACPNPVVETLNFWEDAIAKQLGR